MIARRKIRRLNATKGNPYHDALGRFTDGPEGAFHGEPLEDSILTKRLKAQKEFDSVFNAKMHKSGEAYGKTHYSPESTQAILQAENRASEIKSDYQLIMGVDSSNYKIAKQVHKFVKDVSEARPKRLSKYVSDAERLSSEINKMNLTDNRVADMLGIINTTKYAMQDTIEVPRHFVVREHTVKFLKK